MLNDDTQDEFMRIFRRLVGAELPTIHPGDLDAFLTLTYRLAFRRTPTKLDMTDVLLYLLEMDLLRVVDGGFIIPVKAE